MQRHHAVAPRGAGAVVQVVAIVVVVIVVADLPACCFSIPTLFFTHHIERQHQHQHQHQHHHQQQQHLYFSSYRPQHSSSNTIAFDRSSPLSLSSPIPPATLAAMAATPPPPPLEAATGSSEFVAVFVTVPNDQVATSLSASLVESELAACVNIIAGVQSVYRWEGKVQRDSEQLLMIKTRNTLLDALTAHVRANHPYSVPEVLALPVVGGNADYLSWLAASTRASAPAPAAANQ
jgi:uncharacterized protein involved in tolerance to divalent cations